MTDLRRDLAGLLMPDLRLDAGDALARGRELLALGPLPGFLLFGGRADEVAELTAALDEAAGRPLIYSADLEDGAGQQFRGGASLPSNMAVAATGDPSLAREKGRLTALEAAQLGVRLVFAPVVDVQTAPENPIIGIRAFGDDAATVAAFAVAFCEGVDAGGGLATAKHFPGHGSTTEDSHVELPTARETADAFRARHLAPFAALARRRLAAVMSAHVAVPSLDPSGDPATWSRPLLEDLLRDELGFAGCVISDALLMSALDHVGPGEAAWRSLAAGVDLLLAPKDPVATLDAMTATPAQVPLLAIVRVGRLFAAHCAQAERAAEAPIPPAVEAAALSSRIARESITLLDSQASWRPLTGGGTCRLLLVGQQPDLADIEPLTGALAGALALEPACCPLAELSPASPPADLVVLDSATGAWRPTPFQPADYVERLAACQRAGATLVVLDHPGPARRFAEAGPVLLSYGRQAVQLQALAAVLLGRAEARGNFPGTGEPA